MITIYPDGRVGVPFSSYAGMNTEIPVESLTSDEFRSAADALFGFRGHERQASTAPGWLTPASAPDLLDFCRKVAAAYQTALSSVAVNSTRETVTG